MGEDEAETRRGRRCDFCGEARGVVYCRADTAVLCLRCDRHVHSANSVSARHHRSLLCDVCAAAPTAILCPSPCRLLLCPNCDFDAHQTPGGAVGPIHDRRPVEPYSGCPAAAELASVLGVGDDEKSVLGCGVGADAGGLLGGEEAWVWETPQIVSWDDLIMPATHCHGFQPVEVPPLPKKRNSACGRHKEEMLRQLYELMKLETDVSNDCGELDPFIEVHSLETQQNTQIVNFGSDFNNDARRTDTPTYEVNMLQWNQSDCHEATNPVACTYEQFGRSSSAINTLFVDEAVDTVENHASDGGKVPGHQSIREHTCSMPLRSGHEFVCPDRGSVISRYKEKRKTRRFEKHIRYESRKARADSRMRIKGRFAKASQLVKS